MRGQVAMLRLGTGCWRWLASVITSCARHPETLHTPDAPLMHTRSLSLTPPVDHQGQGHAQDAAALFQRARRPAARVWRRARGRGGRPDCGQLLARGSRQVREGGALVPPGGPWRQEPALYSPARGGAPAQGGVQQAGFVRAGRRSGGLDRCHPRRRHSPRRHPRHPACRLPPAQVRGCPGRGQGLLLQQVPGQGENFTPAGGARGLSSRQRAAQGGHFTPAAVGARG